MKKTLSSYDAISLAGLQGKSALMEREETKYLLHVNQLAVLLDQLQEHYDILDIDGNREFTYENVYFDTDDFFFYHQHLNQVKSRTKIRTRKYVDSNLDFVEYKQKIGSVIKKERIVIGEEGYGNTTTPETLTFLESCFEKYYDHDKKFQLHPSLRNQYKRITLVHKTREERVTIDMQISYSEPGSEKITFSLPHLAIIECKYGEKKPHFAQVMKKAHIPKVNLCSKYCLGAYYLGKTQKYTSFLPTIIYIDTLKNSQGVSANFVKDYQQRIKDNKRQTNQVLMVG